MAQNNVKDLESFIFSFDLKRTYKPTDSNNALYLHKDCGPCFGCNSLAVENPMNAKRKGFCYTNGGVGKLNYYNIGCDEKGNNEITGEGSEINSDEKHF